MVIEEVPPALPSDGASSVTAPAAYRAIQVLEALAASRGPITVGALALRIPLPKSSVSNLLTTLEAAGMVRRMPGGWALSYKALEIGQAVLASTDLVSEFRRNVKMLPGLYHETTLLAVLEGTDVFYLARHDGGSPVRLATDVGHRLPATVTSLGKAMLASLPAETTEALLAEVGPLPRPTRRSHRLASTLLADLAEVRRRGYSIDDEENTIGVTCFGVAIPDSMPVAAVSCTLFTSRVTPAVRSALVADLQKLADRLSPFSHA